MASTSRWARHPFWEGRGLVGERIGGDLEGRVPLSWPPLRKECLREIVPNCVPHHVRELIERREAEWLSPYAMRAADSAGREVAEAPDPVRTCFQRDRDRILHSKAFRRLKHKTQVFLDPVGDHYRTRMTHSLEVAQIARTIGRALRLNEDLIEAIALGHDVGHTPFGHAGEAALDEAIRSGWGVSPQSEGLESGLLGRDAPATFLEAPVPARDLPVTDSSSSGWDASSQGEPSEARVLGRDAPATSPRGFRHYEQSLRVVDVIEKLNLTQETRAGIGGHSKGRKDLTAFDGEPTSTLEAAVVRISDRIAYLNHDLDDAMRSGIISAIPSQFDSLGTSHSARIGKMVQDVILSSWDKPAISLSGELLDLMNELKEWLYEHVYLQYPKLYPESGKAQNVVRELFQHYSNPANLPPGFEGIQGAVDYVAGMTDRFAIEDYTRIKIPGGFRP